MTLKKHFKKKRVEVEEDLNYVSKQILDRMQDLGCSMDSLAESAKFRKVELKFLLNNPSLFTPSDLYRIAEALDCKLEITLYRTW